MVILAQERGVLLSAAGEDGYIEVGVAQGRPYLICKLPNTNKIVLSSTVRVDDINLHTIRVYRINADIRLTVDHELALESKIKTDHFDIIFTKGVKIGQKINNQQNAITGFRGCIFKGLDENFDYFIFLVGNEISEYSSFLIIDGIVFLIKHGVAKVKDCKIVTIN